MAGIVYVEAPGFTTVCIPQGLDPLDEMWQLSHEIAHLTLHHGYTSPWSHDRQEHQADRWAAQAMIPEEAVRRYRNASLDAFIGALSKHYQDLPLENCPERDLASKIARIRLETIAAELECDDNEEEAS
jgi:Zn-dependent peptidase ImmA (M78 family)